MAPPVQDAHDGPQEDTEPLVMEDEDDRGLGKVDGIVPVPAARGPQVRDGSVESDPVRHLHRHPVLGEARPDSLQHERSSTFSWTVCWPRLARLVVTKETGVVVGLVLVQETGAGHC